MFDEDAPKVYGSLIQLIRSFPSISSKDPLTALSSLIVWPCVVVTVKFVILREAIKYMFMIMVLNKEIVNALDESLNGEERSSSYHQT